MVWGDHIRAVNVSRGVIKKSRKAGFFIDVFFYALWRFIASDISSNDAFDGNNGSKYTLAVPGCMRPCLGQYRPASVPTGKIGNFNLYANNNKPRFNGIFWPGFARVPSGNITMFLPLRSTAHISCNDSRTFLLISISMILFLRAINIDSLVFQCFFLAKKKVFLLIR